MRFTQKDGNKFLDNGSRIDWFIFASIVIIAALLFIWIFFGQNMPKDLENVVALATAIFAVLGILVALWQAIRSNRQAVYANYQTSQLLKKDILFSLYEAYMKRDMHRAIDDVWETINQNKAGVIDIPSFLEKPDRYQFLKNYLDAQTLVRQQEIDESRRMVTHFWYLLENLLAQGMLSEHEVFEWFGTPHVIWILEGLEVLKQHADTTEAIKTRWPPLLTLSRYYRSKGVSIERLESGSIPLARLDKVTIEKIKRL